jgi:selenide,water dikinase
MEEAGCIVLGGHSVRDAEMKFGYAVTGMIDPARILTNRGAVPGDTLILAKAIGTGVITTALKQGRAAEAWVNGAVASMTLSNRAGAEIVTRQSFDVHAMTDVTGFGLMGHAREMALGSGVRLEIDCAAVPLLDGAREAVELGCIPAGLTANREFAECFVEDLPGARVPDFLRPLLYDPQTSGGLLISVRPSDADELRSGLRAAGYPAAIIGSVMEGRPKVLLRSR